MEENINYYQEACKLYIANVVLTTQVRKPGQFKKIKIIFFNKMKELVAEKNELLAKISKLEVCFY